MEIVPTPLYSDLEHKDDTEHTEVIRAREIQVMIAGRGVGRYCSHSEYNSNDDKPVNFFQIWVFPDKRNVIPRYDQGAFDYIHNKDQPVQVIGPKDDADNTGL